MLFEYKSETKLFKSQNFVERIKYSCPRNTTFCYQCSTLKINPEPIMYKDAEENENEIKAATILNDP